MHCHEALNNYYEFKKKCILTYQKLKSHMLAVKQKEAKKSSDLKKMEYSHQNITIEYLGTANKF